MSLNEPNILIKNKNNLDSLSIIKINLNLELSLYNKSRLFIQKETNLYLKYNHTKSQNNKTAKKEIKCDLNLIQKAEIFKSSLIHKEFSSQNANGIIDMYFNCKEDQNIKYINQTDTKEELKILFNFPETVKLLLKKNEISKIIEYSPYLVCFAIIFYFFIYKTNEFFKEIKILS